MPLIADTLTNANTFRAMFGKPTNDTFAEQAANIFISRDVAADIIEEYSGMNGSISVKQADVILDTFPLNYQKNYTAKDSLSDLNYVSGTEPPQRKYNDWFVVRGQAVSQRSGDDLCHIQYCCQPGLSFWLLFVYIPAILGTAIRSGSMVPNVRAAAR